MDQRRLELHALLTAIPGVTKAYFQPPSDVQMQFPAIVYKRDSSDTRFAGNHPYSRTKRYEVTVIDRDPDSDIPDLVAKLPMCTHSRTFVADTLNHDVFNIYF